MFILLIPVMFLPNTYYCFLHVESAEVPITISGIGNEYTSTRTVLLFIRKYKHIITKYKCNIFQILLLGLYLYY